MSILGSVLAALNQFYGAKPLAWPKPVANREYPIQVPFIPDLVAADGSGWGVNSSYNTWTRYGPTGTAVYTVSIADINAGATIIAAVYPDYITGRLYFYATGGGNAWLAFTPFASKAMTVRAATTPTTASASVYLEKVGADFTIWSTNTNVAAPAMDSATITESTGAMGASSPFRLNGVNVLAAPAFAFYPPGFYITADRKIVASIYIVAGASLAIQLSRGGGFRVVSFAATNFGSTFNSASPSHTAGAVVNGDQVTILHSFTTGGTTMFPRHYNRAEFDAFLNRACDFAGLPQ
jgi:hypothetical protein